MASYCVSDIHGEEEAFCALLEAIRFAPEDTLYVLGDVVDRGPHGVRLLRRIMGTPNMKLLLGNHELMMREYLLIEMARRGEPVPEGPELMLWQYETAQDMAEPERRKHQSTWELNHNGTTLRDFEALPRQEQRELLAFLYALPLYVDVQVGKLYFRLVHGYPSEDVRTAVWGRPEGYLGRSPYRDRIVVIGHTPVAALEAPDEEEQEAYFRRLEREKDHMKILHSPGGWIGIDCGIAYPVPGRALACLCLDDMRETYVVVEE